MKNYFLNYKSFAAAVLSLGLLASCSSDDDATPVDDNNPDAGNPTELPEGARWITVVGAKMGENPGDGNGGTYIYAINSEAAKDPSVEVTPFENGFAVPSNRTARLQASEDGNVLFNISYAGDTGGNYTRYNIEGGNRYSPDGSPVNISDYVGNAPRWIKLFDGDQTGAAVYVSTDEDVDNNGVPDSNIGVVLLDLQSSKIKGFEEHTIALDEVTEGYYISRIDMPVLNEAGDKLYIGAQVRQVDPATGETVSGGEVLGSKTIVVDYPSLLNPTIINSGIGKGNTNGYRSINAWLHDGYVYQANQGDPKGSHILRIGANNQYDDSYVFNLDAVLGVSGAYVLAWRPTENGKAVLAYRHDGSAESALSGQQQGYYALVDLEAKTATTIEDIAYDPDFYLFQQQGFAKDGNELYLTQAPVGKDGRIYILNTETGEVTEGAKLVNTDGSHFIGTF